jgi:glutamate-1-semialdehyde 2,1-aminomutase
MQQTAVHVQTTNAEQFASIGEVVAGGVSSSMRAQAIPEPLVVQRAKGDRIWDVEDRELIDLNMGYGPHLFGYADPELAAALARQLAEGAMTGLPHRIDRQAGELIARLVPSVEQVRFANSGTEAVASALRLARAATGRTQVLTFDGHYHGWSETVLRAGKATFHAPRPDSTAPRSGALGMIPEALAHTLEVPWNDLSALRAVFEAHGERLAAVICEPVMANACVVPPAPGQLEELRALCDRWGVWLVFDEVITGFRVGRGGAQERYGVTPDLTPSRRSVDPASRWPCSRTTARCTSGCTPATTCRCGRSSPCSRRSSAPPKFTSSSRSTAATSKTSCAPCSPR